MNRKGFTLVELLAVIVILAIILVIAVPKITDLINNTKEASLKSSVQMVAATAETKYEMAQLLGDDSFSGIGECEEWAGLDEVNYVNCRYEIDEYGNAIVKLKGTSDGKFSNWSKPDYNAGCVGTRESVTCIDNANSVPLGR